MLVALNAELDTRHTMIELLHCDCMEYMATVPDNYTDCVSNTQRYKMLGNGWTVDVIAHILNAI